MIFEEIFQKLCIKQYPYYKYKGTKILINTILINFMNNEFHYIFYEKIIKSLSMLLIYKHILNFSILKYETYQ